jgi:hypothetical protein
MTAEIVGTALTERRYSFARAVFDKLLITSSYE